MNSHQIVFMKIYVGTSGYGYKEWKEKLRIRK